MKRTFLFAFCAILPFLVFSEINIDAVAGKQVQFEIPQTDSVVSFSYVSSTLPDYTFNESDLTALPNNTFLFTPPDTPGQFKFAFTVHSGEEKTVLVNVRKNLWWLLMIIGLIGGLGMFLFGMEMMSSGLQKSAGDKMRAVLGKLTNNPAIGVGVGALVTALIQSSGAAAVMLVSFVNSSLMKFRQTLPVILGAAIGTTFTAQLIAFKLTDYALLFVGVGVILYLFLRKQSVKNIGETILGFGLLFYGMHIMSASMYPLRTYDPFLELLLNLENPILGIVAGAIFTAILQSSSAFIGIMIIFASQGFLSLESSLPLLLGANLGTPMPALLSSLKTNVEAKKVAFAQLFYKVVLVLLFFWWLPTIQVWLVDMGNYFSDSGDGGQLLPRQIANGHTIFNVAVTIVALPFIKQTDKLISLLIKSKPEEEPELASIKYLDFSVVAVPTLALNLTKQEMLRLSYKVYGSVEDIIHPFIENDSSYIEKLSLRRNEIKIIRDEIRNYLYAIHRKSGNKQSLNEAYQMLHVLNELSHINDAITKVLLRRAEKWIKRDYVFSEIQRKEIVAYHKETLELLESSINLFKDFNLSTAEYVDASYNELVHDSDKIARFHYDRVFQDNDEEIENSKTHLELINTLQIVGLHARNIVKVFITW